MFPPMLAATIVLLPGCQEYTFTEFESTDIFHQNPWNNVDVLLVVDNSCSMEPYQTKLASDFGAFFEFFDGSEVVWQLGVVHTDSIATDFGRFRGPIVTADHSDPEGLFADIVAVGTNGWGIEAGLEAARRAVSGVNPGFPREDATLSVIFVSDEQDTSPESVAWYVDEFYALKGARNRDAFNASAFTVTSVAECTPEQFQFSSPGTRYIEVAEQTGGVVANLCADDFSPIIGELALTTSAMRDTFFLGTRPNLDTLTVAIEGEDVPCEGNWTFQLVDEAGVERPAIVFTPEGMPTANQQIVAHYKQGQGTTSPYCPPPVVEPSP